MSLRRPAHFTRAPRQCSPLLRAPRRSTRPVEQQLVVAKMLNDENELVDLYLPRKCSWTNKLITSKDHAAVQINIGHLNEEGVYTTGQFSTFALTGAVRAQGEGDSAIDLLWQKRRQDARQ